MYIIKTPQVIQGMFPNFVWKIPTEEKKLYLTLDDGPIPEVTPWVLEQLSAYNARATFFCVGDNVRKYPDIFEEVKRQGHTVGNHTYSHLSGWGTNNLPYYLNIRKCAELVDSALFRPPYGRMLPQQARFLQRHYRIVMWDVLSADFDTKLTGKQCYDNVVSRAEKGSIIVFHDSIKARARLQYALPALLDFYTQKGYTFERIATVSQRQSVVQPSLS